ncbi:MAG: HD domain-containing protein [Syntrophales bacterium]
MKARPIAIPSEAVCMEIISEAGMLENMIAHSLQVQRVSLFIADNLLKSGLNRDLLGAAALLHDITKTRSLQTKEDHARTGELLIAEKGYPEVGRIIGQHVFLESYFLSANPTEAEVVNYADKRVLHDRVASLAERMDYILERYGGTSERRELLSRLWRRSVELEKHLFAMLPFAPEELPGLLEQRFALFPENLQSLAVSVAVRRE